MCEVSKNQFGRSGQSENYLRFRPSYNHDFLKSSLLSVIEEKKQKSETLTAVDLACGSGQLTFKILPWFDQIIGVDVNAKQLEVAQKAVEKSGQEKKLLFVEADCSKIDNVLNLPQIKELNPSIVFIAEAFHWFNYDDFLSRFTNKTKAQGNNIDLVLVGYNPFTVTKGTDKASQLFNEFYDLITPFYKFDIKSLENKYKEYDFKKHFNSVRLIEFDEKIQNQDIREFLGYLDTISAYRNILEFVNNNPEKDPLIILMKNLGLKNFESKNYSEIEIPNDCCKTINYTNQYFLYILSQ